MFSVNKHALKLLFNIVCYFSGSDSCLYLVRCLNAFWNRNVPKIMSGILFSLCFILATLNGKFLLSQRKIFHRDCLFNSTCLTVCVYILVFCLSCLSCFVFLDFGKSYVFAPKQYSSFFFL